MAASNTIARFTKTRPKHQRINPDGESSNLPGGGQTFFCAAKNG
jgi:hypothetical protein